MNTSSLTALARHQLRTALQAPSGRSAHTVYGGHEKTLRQTMIALAAGRSLNEHENPGEATVHVLHGRVTLTCGDDADGVDVMMSSSQLEDPTVNNLRQFYI